MIASSDAPKSLKVVVVAGLKGGCGKTTLTALLAVHSAQDGRRVAVMDCDPQQGLTNWFERREARLGDEIGIALVDISDDGDIAAGIADVAAADDGFNLIVIDTPPGNVDVVTNAISHADLVVVPCGATTNDLETVPDTREVIDGKPYLFVLQRVEERRATSQAAAVLSKAGRVAEEMIAYRPSYADAPAKGLAGNEQDKAAKAEVAAIWDEIESILYAPLKAERRLRIRGGVR